MQPSDSKLVSIVIPTRNRQPRLARAIASALAQTWPAFEVIVVDDASSDTTPIYLDDLARQEARLRFVSNSSPAGGAGARNQGVALARGHYIAFLDDDDVWMEDKLSMQITLLQACPEASAVSCGFVVESGARKPLVVHVRPPDDEQHLLRVNHLGGASMCVTSKALLSRIGGYDAQLRSSQDWDLWLKLYAQGPILVCEEPLVCYMAHQDARITSNPRSVYAGRRRLYFRYKMRMDSEVRAQHLCELLYHRRVLLNSRVLVGGMALLCLMRKAGGLKGVRYLYRYLRFVTAKLWP